MSKIIISDNDICKPWVEKHRPKHTIDIAQQENLKKIVDDAQIHSNLPHLLLHGPPGCGKTTTAISIRRQYFYDKNRTRQENIKIHEERVLELNASDERGIQVVKGKIKMFAEKTIVPRKGIPDFKLIILDECDAMTSDSQLALRRTMEDYSIDTRFIMICNNINQIIVPVRSRTSMIRYKHIDVNHMKTVITKIALIENLTLSNKFITRLHSITNGDLRKAINLIEQCYLMYDSHSIDALNECAGMISADYFENIIRILTDPKSTIHVELLNLTNDFINEAYSMPSLLYDLFNYINDMESIENSDIKMKLMDVMSSVDASINIKSSESVVIMYLFTSLHKILTA
jgi:replication factor C subunit 2/4